MGIFRDLSQILLQPRKLETLDGYISHDAFCPFIDIFRLVEETEDLSGNVLASSLLVVHDTSGGGEDDVSELTGWQKLDNPLLEILDLDVVSWGDNTGLVETAVQLNNNLSGTVVINLLEFSDVTLLLHDTEELDDDLGGWADEDLTLSGLLGVVDGVERIIED